MILVGSGALPFSTRVNLCMRVVDLVEFSPAGLLRTIVHLATANSRQDFPPPLVCCIIEVVLQFDLLSRHDLYV